MGIRFNATYGRDGGYDAANMEQQAADLREQRDAGTIPGQPAPAPSSPEAPPPAPTGGGPGPVTRPSPEGGPAAAPAPPVPPAVASSIPGVEGSETTGGVRGSFGQAGTAGFSKRFGMPAAWFRGGPTAGLAREKANVGRDVLGKDRAGSVGGGGTTVANVAGPSLGAEGGGENDEEFQRVIQEVLRNRFSRG